MPERSGFKTDGGWSTGNEQVNGTSVNQTLTVNDRDLNTPDEYKASKWIEFTDGFESGSSDEFVAYIADGNNTTSGNTSGSGGENNSYRYGFNGKENDDEVKGTGDQQDYGMRIYDGRLGKFLSVDPLTRSYPQLTPYQYASNRPIDGIDVDGMEYLKSSEALARFLFVELKTTTTYTTVNKQIIAHTTITGIGSGQGELNLANCSGWLSDFCKNYNENRANWHDENGNTTIGTRITWLQSFVPPVVPKASDAKDGGQMQDDLEKFAKSPSSTYGRGTVPNVPSVRSSASAGSTSVGGGKVGGAITAMTYIAKGYAKLKSMMISDEVKTATDQFAENGWRVCTRLEYAIQQKMIPGEYLNGKNVTALANYLLSGVIPMIELRDGSKIEDVKLKEFAQKLWNATDNLYQEIKEKRFEWVGTGNSGNTGTAPKAVQVEVTVYKKI